MPRLNSVAALTGLMLLAACGTKEPERAEGGAAAGAGTGAAIGLIGGPPGVAVGALAGGAAGGVATKPSDVNLGAPPWYDNSQAGQNAAQHMAQ
jgi:phage tail tape-measure protein